MENKGKQWVLLAAGSKDWENYRHQADVCHAYQVVHRNGIPDEQIVVMMYDDIAYNPLNPVLGNIINERDGPNVYLGVPKDYTGKDVSADNFLAILSGNEPAVKNTGPKKVIQSGENDTIFIYLVDHGGQGVFHFPDSTLHAHDLIKTVHEMVMDHKFSKMVIYIEACHSGSMLEELADSNVYAVSACRPDESSYAFLYDKIRYCYLADVFSYYWLWSIDNGKRTSTTFGDQFSYLLANVPKAVRKKEQTPCNYGDKSILDLMLSRFLGKSSASVSQTYMSQPLNVSDMSDVVDTTDVPLIIQENRIKNEQDPEKKQALKREYDDLIRKRKTVDEALQKIAELTNTLGALTEKREVSRTYELKVIAEHFRENLFDWHKEPYVVTRPHFQILVNLCESGLDVDSIIEAITDVSSKINF
ncbi:legumain-like [Clarias gariepinus]|uniref:legumain-like n=1 Tax=Clarias gariepinus TaxID=13013 RepID=UPI00234D6094|nr:legumain-like [Clarias gariepinus]